VPVDGSLLEPVEEPEPVEPLLEPVEPEPEDPVLEPVEPVPVEPEVEESVEPELEPERPPLDDVSELPEVEPVEPVDPEPEPMEPVPLPEVEPPVELDEPEEPSDITSSFCTFMESPEPEKLARTWSPSLMSLIDARAPSFVTSVLESTFSVFPCTSSVLFERSNWLTRPETSLPVLADAEALSEEPVLLLPRVPLEEPDAEPLVPGVELLVEEPLDGSLVELPLEPMLPDDPVLLLPDEPLIEPDELVPEPLVVESSAAIAFVPANVSTPAASATHAFHPICFIRSSPSAWSRPHVGPVLLER
jgi:hypothetical protein